LRLILVGATAWAAAHCLSRAAIREAGMRILLIVNEHARHGREPLDPALQVFAAAGMKVVEERIKRGRYVDKPIRRHAKDVDAIVLAGGDGTVHDAAEELIEAELPFGVLPRGTANDLARAVGLPLDLRRAAEVIAARRTRRIDVGEVNKKPFFNVAHIGLGAALADALSDGMKKRLGPFAYTVAAALALTKIRRFRAEISAGGECLTLRSYAITIGNGRYFGGGGVVAEDATIDDGLLHLFALQSKNPIHLARLLPSLSKGRQGRFEWVETLTASKIEVRTVRKLKIRADGKTMSETPASFRVRRGALEIFAPAKPAD
jgi:YegS/Rv2252/BmrU family lipid kinase